MKKIKFIIIGFLFSFTSISCNTLLGLRSEENIGEYILKNTPVGSSKEHVNNFIKKKGYEIEQNKRQDMPHILSPIGFVIPEYNKKYIYKEERVNIAGSSRIFVKITEYFFTAVLCIWIFDDKEKLILIEIKKEINSL